MKKITIAIDGFSSCGKSTMAKDLAKELGYIYIDSGAMYRAVTLFCLKNGLIEGEHVAIDRLASAIDQLEIAFKQDEHLQTFTLLNGENVEKEIRSMQVSGKVSIISAIPLVRKALVAQQQRMGKEKGIVMDGRDIGTTVFPNAEMKVFVTASPEIRAQRRVDELLGKGETASFEDVLRNVEERDYIDQNRKESPLRKAEDAYVLDNSHMTIAEQKAWLLSLYRKIANE